MSEAIISLSEAAAAEIERLQEAKGLTDIAIRVEVRDLAGRMYSLRFTSRDEQKDGDLLVESCGVALLIDPRSASRIEGV